MGNALRWGVFGLFLLCPAVALAGSESWQPTPNDLWDLDHTQYITWGIGWSLPAGERITSASIFIDNINDWQVESGDIMYIHLLDNPQLGTHHWTDNEGGGDAFAGQGILLTTYTDDDGAPNPAEDFQYDFTPEQRTTLATYLDNGVFGLGFDPDCHYYNCGVTLTVTTATIPEPAAGVLMMAVGTVVLRTRRRLNLGR